MKENFHKSTQISPEMMKMLQTKRNWPTIFHFLLMLVCYLLAAWSVVWAWSSGWWWAMVITQLFMGLMVCSVFACLHETVHNTAFANLKLNQIAAFVLGILHIYPAATFRELHFTHHRHTHQPNLDPEISIGGQPAPSVVENRWLYLAWLTGLPLLLFKIAMLMAGVLAMPEWWRKRMFSFVAADARWGICWQSWITAAFHSFIIYWALAVDSSFWALCLGQVVGHSFLGFYLIMEHNGLDHDGDILARTRSIVAPKWLKWLMWNMPYHAEHHAYPAIPYHALPNLHEILKPELAHQSESHNSFHRNLVGKLFLNQKR